MLTLTKKSSLFIFPILLILGSLFWIQSRETEESKPKAKKQVKSELYGKKTNLKVGDQITLAQQEIFNPQVGKDFAIFFWFQANKYPSADQRISVLAKHQQEAPANGYTFGIANYDQTLHPQAYWKSNAEGRWYSFAEFKFKPKRWYGILLSYSQNKYLGMHVFYLGVKGKLLLKNLGGYELENVFPSTEENLRIGSIGKQKFSGKLGKLFVLNAPSEKFSLEELLEFLQKQATFGKAELERFGEVFYQEKHAKTP